MKKHKKNFEKLGPNILALRKGFGESQTELGLEVGVKKNTISQYEKGNRIPSDEIISKIAKHYRVTVTSLLQDDYSNAIDFDKIPVNCAEHTKNTFDLLGPRFSDEEALKNQYFKLASRMQDRVCVAMNCGYKFDPQDFWQLISLYQKALDDGIILGAANLLSLLVLLCGGIFSLTPNLIEKMKRLKGRETTAKEIVTAMLFFEDETDGEDYLELERFKVNFIEGCSPIIHKCLYTLKNDEKYSSLADYYLALSYIFGIVSSDISKEQSFLIGHEMMQAFAYLGNSYAKQFSDF